MKHFLILALMCAFIPANAQSFAAIPDILSIHLPSYSQTESIDPAYLVINHMTGSDTIDIGHFTLTPEEFADDPTAYSTTFFVSRDLTGQCMPVWWAYMVSSGCQEAWELHLSNVIIYVGNRQLIEFMPRPDRYLDYMAIDYGWR